MQSYLTTSCDGTVVRKSRHSIENQFLGEAKPLIVVQKKNNKIDKGQFDRRCGNIECKYNAAGDNKKVTKRCTRCGTGFCNTECLKASWKQQDHYCYCKINSEKYSLYIQHKDKKITRKEFLDKVAEFWLSEKHIQCLAEVCEKKNIDIYKAIEYSNMFKANDMLEPVLGEILDVINKLNEK